MNILDNCNLTDEEADVAAVVIDLFGEGDHPSPTEQSIYFFTPDYTIECLERARKVGLVRYNHIIDALLVKLRAHQNGWGKDVIAVVVSEEGEV